MIFLWLGFLVLILALLALDLGVLNRRDHVPGHREAVTFTIATIVIAVLFAVFVHAAYAHHWQGLGLEPDAIDGRLNDGRSAAVKFLTGYIVELSLSMDNVFVMVLIFGHMRVPAEYQHRVLFWGIVGALVMRGAMIVGGAAMVSRFHWVMYLFGAFLVITCIRMLLQKGESAQTEERRIATWLNRTFRVTKDFHGHRFVLLQDGKRWLTPLAVALVLIETTDLLFAVDSIPAVFAITNDPFIVFTSNVFAVICLRSLYFGLAGLLRRFRYLNVSVAMILGIVGVKMLATTVVDRLMGAAQNIVTLCTVVVILGLGAVASLLAEYREQGRAT